jgi:hypothetical protein
MGFVISEFGIWNLEFGIRNSENKLSNKSLKMGGLPPPIYDLPSDREASKVNL